MRKSVILTLAGIALTVPASADSITYVGDDLTTHGAWRTPSVIKPLDDGNNIYGSDGYAVLDPGGSNIIDNPADAFVTRLAANVYPGNGSYLKIDNPTGSGQITTGTWYDSTGSGTVDNYAEITFTGSATYRVGILIDNQDFADISPNQLRINQTVGGSADSGYINSFNSVNNGDWYFFDITGVAGDVFVISGTNYYGGSPAQASDGLGLISFDGPGGEGGTVPEPATLLLVGAGLLGIARRRK